MVLPLALKDVLGHILTATGVDGLFYTCFSTGHILKHIFLSIQVWE